MSAQQSTTNNTSRPNRSRARSNSRGRSRGRSGSRGRSNSTYRQPAKGSIRLVTPGDVYDVNETRLIAMITQMMNLSANPAAFASKVSQTLPMPYKANLRARPSTMMIEVNNKVVPDNPRDQNLRVSLNFFGGNKNVMSGSSVVTALTNTSEVLAGLADSFDPKAQLAFSGTMQTVIPTATVTVGSDRVVSKSYSQMTKYLLQSKEVANTTTSNSV